MIHDKKKAISSQLPTDILSLSSQNLSCPCMNWDCTPSILYSHGFFSNKLSYFHEPCQYFTRKSLPSNRWSSTPKVILLRLSGLPKWASGGLALMGGFCYKLRQERGRVDESYHLINIFGKPKRSWNFWKIFKQMQIAS